MDSVTEIDDTYEALRTGVEVWDTEAGDAVAWGTHDVSLALRTYAHENGWEDPSDAPDGELPEFSSAKYWAHPQAKEEEMWDEGTDYSSTLVEGRVPYLVSS